MIIAKGTITVTEPNNNEYDKKSTFKNNAQFISWIKKISNTVILNVKELDVVMPMYNLIK